MSGKCNCSEYNSNNIECAFCKFLACKICKKVKGTEICKYCISGRMCDDCYVRNEFCSDDCKELYETRINTKELQTKLIRENCQRDNISNIVNEFMGFDDKMLRNVTKVEFVQAIVDDKHSGPESDNNVVLRRHYKNGDFRAGYWSFLWYVPHGEQKVNGQLKRYMYGKLQ